MKRPKTLKPEQQLMTLGDLARYHERWVVPLEKQVEELRRTMDPPPDIDTGELRNIAQRMMDKALHVEQEPSA